MAFWSNWFKRKDPRPVTDESGGGAVGAVHQTGTPPRRSSRALLNVVSHIPVFQKGIAVRAEALASVRPILYRSKRVKDPFNRWGGLRGPMHVRQATVRELVDKDDIEPVFDHAFLDLLNKPSPSMTGRAFWILWSKYMDLNGEAFVIKEGRIPSRPDALWMWPSHWCRQTATLHDPFFYFQNGAWMAKEPAERVWWPKIHDPLDPLARGVGLAEGLADELEASEYAAIAVKSGMFNRGVPDFIMSVENQQGQHMNLSPEEKERLEAEIEAKYRSPSARGRFMLASRKITVEKISHTMIESGTIEIREQLRDFILAHLGVPRELVGITNDGNRATSETAMDRLYIGCTLPMCEFRRTELQEFLLCEWGEQFILDYESPLREDKRLKLETMKSRPEAFTVDEWRAMAGDPPLPNGVGEVHLVNPGLIAAPTPTAAPPPRPALPPAEPENEDPPLLTVVSE